MENEQDKTTERFIRTQMLLGTDNMERLAHSHVTIFGIGGVGSYVAEAVARSGVGGVTLIDSDTIATSNINRQIHALTETVGKPKTEVMAERILQINPCIKIETSQTFVTADNAFCLIPKQTGCIIDAIDTISSKIALISAAKQLNIDIISSMGMANKIKPEKIELADIAKTKICPLAKVMRYELKQRGISGIMTCYSTEEPIQPLVFDTSDIPNNKRPLGSIAFVPSAAGLVIAGWVVRRLCGLEY